MRFGRTFRLGLLLVSALAAACGDSSGDGDDGEGGAGSGTLATGPGSGPGSGSGAGTSLGDCPIFPADNAWNIDIRDLPVRPESDEWIGSIGRDDTLHADFGTEYEGAPIGIPYVVVSGSQAKVDVVFTDYPEESDPGPYPIPPDAPVEGGPDAEGDRHVIVIDGDTCTLYEMFYAYPQDDGASWEAACGAVFDLKTNDEHPLGWTSADAAGLPIFPGLVRYEEIEAGEITHAIRMTASATQRAFVPPARHFAGDDDPSLPPMGLRLRMKEDYDCSGYSREVQVLCDAFKVHGMIIADNGSSWYLTGVPDQRWNDEALQDLGDIPGDAFEAVDTGELSDFEL